MMKGMISVVDINSFLLMILYILGSVLLVVLILLGIKLINTITKVDNIVSDVEDKVGKVNKLLSIVDVVTDSMAVISDKIVDGISNVVKKVLVKEKRKGDGKKDE